MGGSSGRITYSIISGNEKNAFLIQPSSGTAPEPHREAARESRLCSASACSAITALRVLQRQRNAVYTSVLLNLIVLVSHQCPEEAGTAPGKVLVPANWTFPKKFTSPAQELAEATTLLRGDLDVPLP